MGNVATVRANVKADEAGYSAEPKGTFNVGEPNSQNTSRRDYNDNDQLARMGKKQVLRVSLHYTCACNWLPKAID